MQSRIASILTVGLALFFCAAALSGSLGAQKAEIEVEHDNDNIGSGAATTINLIADVNARLLFRVKNTGGATLTVVAPVFISGKDNCDVTLDTWPQTSLAPGEETTFALKVKPQKMGDYDFDVRIVSSDANENPFDFKVHGDVLEVGVEEVTRCSTSETASLWQAALCALLAALMFARLCPLFPK